MIPKKILNRILILLASITLTLGSTFNTSCTFLDIDPYITDLFTLAESRLLESRLTALMIPSAAPVNGPVGSGFGVRTDPFNSRPALHTGLDFPAQHEIAIVFDANPAGGGGKALNLA